MLIIGIDPGLAKTGWGIIKKENNRLSYIAAGTIETKVETNIAGRLLIIYDGIFAVLEKFQPTQAAMEETFVNVNSKSSLKLAHARGAAMVALAKYGTDPAEYAPNLIKKTIVGVGRAEKEQVQHMVKIILPTSGIQKSDAADALAVAICHSSFLKYSNL